MSNVLTAFQDKMASKTSVYDNHAVIVDTQYEPFLITQFELFFMPLQELTSRLQKYKAETALKNVKRTAALLFLLLAIPFAALYFLYAIHLFSFTFPAWVVVVLKEEIFLAALALLLLWHDLSTNFDSLKFLPKYPEIDDYLKQSIEDNGVQFQQYEISSPLDYFHPVTFDLLMQALQTKKGTKAYIDSAVLLRHVLKHENIKKVLERLEIDNVDEVIKNLQITEHSAPIFQYIALQSFILYATEQAILTGSSKVYPEHVLLALFAMFPLLQDILSSYKIDFLTIRKAIEWYIITEQYHARINPFDLSEPYYPRPGIIDHLARSTTHYLDSISTNAIEAITRKGGIYGVGHIREVNSVVGLLQKQLDTNIMLIGEPGVGKSSIIYGLAQRLLDGTVPKMLKGLQVRVVDVEKFLALGALTPGGIGVLQEKLQDELRSLVGTILYFDNLEDLLTTNTGESTTMAYIMPLLLASPVPVIGTISNAEYNTLRETHPDTLAQFKEVRVDEPSLEDTFTILTSHIAELEQLYQVTISITALRDILSYSALYETHLLFPRKAVTIEEQAAIQAAQTPEKRVTRQVVATITKTLPRHQAIENFAEMEKLLTLEKRIHQQFINQDETVTELVNALIHTSQTPSDSAKPLCSFLFVGPSGVGKTELAHIVAAELFGHNFSLIRVDFSETQTAADLAEQLQKVTTRKHALLLLENLERATAPQFAILERLLKEGVLITETGESVYFTHTLVVATSTFGADLLATTPVAQQNEVKVYLSRQLRLAIPITVFDEFSSVLFFSALTLEHLQQIAVLQLNALAHKLSEQGIQAIYHEQTINYLVSHGYTPGSGARPLKKVMQNTLERQLASYILDVQQKTGKNPAQVNFDTLLENI